VAPFLSHLMIGERVWLSLQDWRPASDFYGVFLFGCLAPDIDKFCPDLEQGTTHFLPKDEGRTWVHRRTLHFLEHPDRYLRAPFSALASTEQAFVLGYLCHVATDEVTGKLAQDIYQRLISVDEQVPGPDAVLTVVDPRLWSMALDPEAMIMALEQASIPGGTLPFAPTECLRALYHAVLPQVREGGGLEPYLRTVRRHRRFMRGLPVTGDIDPDLEAELDAARHELERGLPQAERLVDGLDLLEFARDAVERSCQRIACLLAEENVQ
jgi:hypothetical protein